MVKELIKLLQDNGDIEQAKKMSAYMQDKFTFAGITKPQLKKLIKPFLTKTAKQPLDRQMVIKLWNVDYREAQYIALEYLQKHDKQLQPTDMCFLKELITTKSWWETVDTLDAFVGTLLQKDETLKETILQWATDDNMWLRRVAINCQQTLKENTDTALLEKCIVSNLHSTEFFINKAIGWSLRDYSKVNPDWVRNFIDKYHAGMALLSIKEATKYISFSEE